MTAFKCAIEEAGRKGAERCKKVCPSCAKHQGDVRIETVMETFDGFYFDFDHVRPEDICLIDIATALSTQTRFGGHIKRFYSIAEHAVRVSNYVADAGGDAELQLAALHHDSHEAYIGDIPTPMKRWFEKHGSGPLLSDLADQIDGAIAIALGVPSHLFHDPLVKKADIDALYREAATLKKSKGVGVQWGTTEAAKRLRLAGLMPAAAIELFLDRHKELMAACS
jgi:hypothetical protein